MDSPPLELPNSSLDSSCSHLGQTELSVGVERDEL